MIGDGNNINIWSDKWLPNQQGFRVWTLKPTITRYTLVKDLIDPNSNQWKTSEIEENFLPFEAEQILQIPLTDNTQQDELIWADTKDGNYSVRSGYFTN
jgi:hypothetical protein